MSDPLARVRRICLALPEVSERMSHGHPAWFVAEKRQVASFHDSHHGDERVALWVPAPPGAQEAFVANFPDRYFRPPYVGHRGWLGIDLEGDVDWDECAAHLHDAYRLVAPKRLVGTLEARRGERSAGDQ
jgi:hypothetical protein